MSQNRYKFRYVNAVRCTAKCPLLGNHFVVHRIVHGKLLLKSKHANSHRHTNIFTMFDEVGDSMTTVVVALDCIIREPPSSKLSNPTQRRS